MNATSRILMSFLRKHTPSVDAEKGRVFRQWPEIRVRVLQQIAEAHTAHFAGIAAEPALLPPGVVDEHRRAVRIGTDEGHGMVGGCARATP